ncbi:MAG: right-handed parallel beta-helix repeat-containing protein, partial [Gammaproteobacteria bacterium]|nr:right-handed parallel beta-helix repeat-containing protein [Gammaproteobacteria bacterium]
ISPGSYESFIIKRTGVKDKPIRFIAKKGVLINRFNDSGHGITVRSNFPKKYYVDNIHLIGFQIESPKKNCIHFTKAISTRPTTGHVISNVSCRNPGTGGFYLSQVADSYISQNIIINAGRDSRSSARDHGIYLSNGGTGNLVLYKNIISGSSTNGIHCNGDMTVDMLDDGTHGGINGTDGLISGLIIDSNIIMGNGQNGINLDGVQDSIFVNNIIYKNNRHGVRGYAIDAKEGPKRLIFINNTFLENKSAIKLSEIVSDYIIFNNLFVRQSSDEIIVPIKEFSKSNNLVNNSVKFLNLFRSGFDTITEREALDMDFYLDNESSQLVLDKGLLEFMLENAPGYDLKNRVRVGMPDIGAMETK